MEVVIWWTNQKDCDNIGDYNTKNLPTYILEQFKSREGRNGRGRLWVEDFLGSVEINPWPNNRLGNLLERDYAGIAIDAKDIDSIKSLPGLITDLKLDLI